MSITRAWRQIGCVVVLIGTLSAFQLPFHEYPSIEHNESFLPPDWQEKTEWAFARLMFPPGENNGYAGRDGDWHKGYSLWTQDYPPADRHFSQALRRLTRIHTRSVEQVINLDNGDEVFNWPWVYAVQVGEWGLTSQQGKVLREYLLRGGFFMADDFHGPYEWEVFAKSMKLVFPDRQIVDIEDSDPIFHTLYDLDDRFQIPGQAHLRAGYKNERGAHWRAIRDDSGRIMVAISYNSDIGDAWEWADNAQYPEKFADLAIRIGVNYIVYSMSH